MKLKVKDIITCIEEIAPLYFQESYDNAGLITGNPEMEIESALLTVDVTEQIIDEAIDLGIKLIISHHPIIFSGLKKITGKNYIERCIIKAIKNDIALYAAHTNVDAVKDGLNSKIATKIGLINTKILQPTENILCKVIVFVPTEHAEKIRTALFNAGAGNIGNYDSCSYNSIGEGSFKASKKATPYVGKIGEIHFEKETKIECIFPKYLNNNIIRAIKDVHPYEEPAFDIIPLNNQYSNVGMGLIGDLPKEEDEISFLNRIKQLFNVEVIRHTSLLNKNIKKVSICGGSGSSLLSTAIANKAAIFITADFKYHQFFDADNRILIADLGHFESESVVTEFFYEVITKKFPNFAVRLTKISSNPINYLK